MAAPRFGMKLFGTGRNAVDLPVALIVEDDESIQSIVEGGFKEMGAVFLVEDEALIRMMIADMVEELGHRVVAEAGSIQAAEPLARTTVFDLGILDINIGGFNISPIAEIIDGRGLPFMFVSGYGAKGRPVLFSDRPVLQKPFLISKFAEMINSSLGEL